MLDNGVARDNSPHSRNEPSSQGVGDGEMVAGKEDTWELGKQAGRTAAWGWGASGGRAVYTVGRREVVVWVSAYASAAPHSPSQTRHPTPLARSGACAAPLPAPHAATCAHRLLRQRLRAGRQASVYDRSAAGPQEGSKGPSVRAARRAATLPVPSRRHQRPMQTAPPRPAPPAARRPSTRSPWPASSCLCPAARTCGVEEQGPARDLVQLSGEMGKRIPNPRVSQVDHSQRRPTPRTIFLEKRLKGVQTTANTKRPSRQAV